MRTYLACLITWIISLNGLTIFAQPVAQTDAFTAHVEKLFQALPSLEQNLQQLQDSYKKLQSTYDTLDEQYKKSTSIFEKATLFAKLTYYKPQLHSAQSKLHTKNVRIATYYCVLNAFNRYTISSEKRAEIQKYAADIQKIKVDLKKQAESAKKRGEAAAKRLAAIPQEISDAETKAANLGQELKLLEEKKTWGNLAERLELKTRQGYQKSRVVKLKAENMVQTKIRDDSLTESASLQMEEREVNLALQVLGVKGSRDE